MDSEIQNVRNPVSRGDWTLFVRSKVPADCMRWAQCDLLDQIDWEEMGTYQSKQFDIDFPYYRNKEKKIIVVKGKSSIKWSTYFWCVKRGQYFGAIESSPFSITLKLDFTMPTQ